MPDDEVIYEGRKATRRAKHRSRYNRAGSAVEVGGGAIETYTSSSSRTKGMRSAALAPEVEHPSQEIRAESGMTSDIAQATALRNAGKQVFLSVVKETVELVALEAASKAFQEETDRADGMQQTARRERANGSGSGGRPHRRHASRGVDIPPPAARPGMGPAGDSACGSAIDSQSPDRASNGLPRGGGSNGNGAAAGQSSDRRRRRSRNSSISNGEGSSIVSAALAGGGAGWKDGDGPGMPFRDTTDTMEDEEREALMALLSGAYSQVNELTDELKISLDKLHDTEKELKGLSRSESNSQLLPKTSPIADDQSVQDAEVEDTMDRSQGKRKPVTKFLKGMFPNDEGAKSTPANVRQLQVEVQRLRQRLAQASSKEEKYRSDLARHQRLMSVMEMQLQNTDGGGGTSSPHVASRGANGNRSSSSSPYCKTPGGTRHQDGITKPLVDRVAELEEKLVCCSMENATAKQDHLTVKLHSSQLEKNTQRLRHELAKSRAMNDLLQNEIDRLQGTLSPEGEADGKGWRRWLGGLQEPLSPEPNPIRVSGDSESPVVVVRDLDNNQLVYAPGRSEFM